MNTEFTKDSNKKLRDLIGDLKEKIGRFSYITNTNVFCNNIDKKYMSLNTFLGQPNKIDDYVIYSVHVKGFEDIGYLLTKDDKPLILSSIYGKDRGFAIFKDIFAVAGTEGNMLYDINNPTINKFY